MPSFGQLISKRQLNQQVRLMGLLKKNKESVEAVDKEAISGILAEGTLVAGDISFKGKARVDGRIEGNVSGDSLILSESGIIIGDIEVTVVVCQGRVDGNIKAEKLHAQPTAKINGSLDVIDLTVDSGASLNGNIKAHSPDIRLVEGTVQSKKIYHETTEKEANQIVPR
jgi:cytoskeletal protein CcmA (bactofilin family)